MAYPLSTLTTDLWENSLFVWIVAVVAVISLMATWWLLRLTRRRRVRAAVVCAAISVMLHGLLFFLMPMLPQRGGGMPQEDGEVAAVVADVTFANLDPDQPLDQQSAAEADAPPIAPLPVFAKTSSQSESQPLEDVDADAEQLDSASSPASESSSNEAMETLMPETILSAESQNSVDDGLNEMLSSLLLPDEPAESMSDTRTSREASNQESNDRSNNADDAIEAMAVSSSPASASMTASAHRVPNDDPEDFAQRFGDAKRAALLGTGGDEQTEAAVEAAIAWLARYQRPDGSWDPIASGAGREEAPLGLRRDAAGRKATTGLTGLALLSMLGAGNTHREGPYAQNVFDGLSYLIRTQAPDGSLAGEAGMFARTYSHGMAALALCEAAAMTGDPQAIAAARAAVAHTVRLQHPVTGGWRYVARDPGDLSQLGWQAMVLESGRRATIAIPEETHAGIFRFLESVRGGNHGGLAAYRPGEQLTRTMTAEALATRLLLGENVPAAEIAEAEAFLLEEPPGAGRANYYYWYYASLALHQLQDAAWHQWNQHLKRALVSTQQADGSWPTNSVWGGYGGRVYTTAVGCLCLEVYYRHAADRPRVAAASDPGQAATIQR